LAKPIKNFNQTRTYDQNHVFKNDQNMVVFRHFVAKIMKKSQKIVIFDRKKTTISPKVRI